MGIHHKIIKSIKAQGKYHKVFLIHDQIQIAVVKIPMMTLPSSNSNKGNSPFMSRILRRRR